MATDSRGLTDLCRLVLSANWREGRSGDTPFSYTAPSPERYPWQWYWDSCFAASGKLVDRYGRVRIIRIALRVYGVGLLVPLLTATPLLIVPAIPLIAFGGGVTMTLPYALLMPMMPPEQHGSVTGLYSISRGVGIMLGPLLAGIAVQLGSGPLSGTHGYAAIWLVASAAILGSLRLLARISARRVAPERA